MLTLFYHLQALKWGVPGALMIGTAPSYYIVWGAFRCISALLPSRVFTTGDDFMWSMYQRLVLLFFENYSGVQLIISGDAKKIFEKKENAIMICNHQSTVDWIVADMLAIRQGSLGHIRYILKHGLMYFPLYGYYFRQHSCIYVKRSGRFQHEKAVQQLDELKYSQIPFWMVIFPEATRLNRKTLKMSKEFATNNGLPDMDYVLTPRYKATQLSIDRLRESLDAVYDVTIAYSNTIDPVTHERISAPGLSDFLEGASPKLHLLVNRIDINDIPHEEKEIKLWLQERFVKKDKVLETFYKESQSSENASLSTDGTVNLLSLKETLPSFVVFMALNISLLSTKEGRSIYWKSAIFGTLVGWIWVTVRP